MHKNILKIWSTQQCKLWYNINNNEEVTKICLISLKSQGKAATA
jgi:hypothetical protein